MLERRQGITWQLGWLGELILGALGTLWRWRLELSLAAIPYLAHDWLVPRIGDLVAIVLVVAGVVGVLAIGPLRCWLWEELRAANLRRRWRRAWLDTGLPPVTAGKVTQVPAGDRIRVRVSRGSSLDHVASHAEPLAACLRLRELRVTRDRNDAAHGP